MTHRFEIALIGITIATLGCNGRSVEAPSAPPVSQPCAFTIAPDKLQEEMPVGGGDIQIPVTTRPDCRWQNNSPNFLWIKVLNLNFLTGPDTLRVTISANSGPQRNGAINIIGYADDSGRQEIHETISVHQAAIEAPPPSAPSFFWINSLPDADRGLGLTKALTDRDANFAATMQYQNSGISVTATARDTPRAIWSVLFATPPGGLLKVGAYENARSSPVLGQPSLSFVRSEIGNCDGGAGSRFTILELQPQPSSASAVPARVDRIHATFEFHCPFPENDPVYGEVWYVRQ